MTISGVWTQNDGGWTLSRPGGFPRRGDLALPDRKTPEMLPLSGGTAAADPESGGAAGVGLRRSCGGGDVGTGRFILLRGRPAGCSVGDVFASRGSTSGPKSGVLGGM